MTDHAQTVILLHGLGRTGRSLLALELDLRAGGYATHSLDYPSTRRPIAALAQAVAASLAADGTWHDTWHEAQSVHFVTHSMGGIVLRWLLERELSPAQRQCVGRVVMLAPPNQGSAVAALTSTWPLARHFLGPALSDLTPAQMHIAPEWDRNIPLGIIAGTEGRAYPLGQLCLSGPHDGRVSVAETRLAGMRDQLVLPASHSLMMRRRDVRRQVLHFLDTGWFDRAEAAPRVVGSGGAG